ncbi:hypothetical protein HBI23_172790 [Parastagonospora nodorum]|nr:hypothetical protein HBH52_097450 [Parastagonospora nodorum]KAH4064099.1 hypothetical protein HBH50_182470 [Parastagonospora nodorum]KAH4087479.1 hypothetical protein HBH48_132780 [Parastagonospora nodorum]KAH5411781.1 hypothetical protein HBI47_159460 [Parastagonospora nodorum]KAH5649222.1 hypothetical protein HBI23_172790 [Parastagonospora nodorum]
MRVWRNQVFLPLDVIRTRSNSQYTRDILSRNTFHILIHARERTLFLRFDIPEQMQVKKKTKRICAR